MASDPSPGPVARLPPRLCFLVLTCFLQGTALGPLGGECLGFQSIPPGGLWPLADWCRSTKLRPLAWSQGKIHIIIYSLGLLVVGSNLRSHTCSVSTLSLSSFLPSFLPVCLPSLFPSSLLPFLFFFLPTRKINSEMF